MTTWTGWDKNRLGSLLDRKLGGELGSWMVVLLSCAQALRLFGPELKKHSHFTFLINKNAFLGGPILFHREKKWI